MEKKWIVDLTEELKKKAEVSQDELERWKKRSIYKIPAHALNVNKEAYKPWMLALGPFNHGDEHLERMEDHKQRAFRHFLRRSQKPLENYVNGLAKVVDDLMDAYDRLDMAWKRNAKEFLKLMIVDGCFILEIMRAATKTMDDYDPSDLIFSDHGKHNTIPCLRRDMLLLENQVPLLALERLLAVETDNINNIEQNEKKVTKLILEFCGQNGVSLEKVGKCQHILDALRKSLIWDVHNRKPGEGEARSATEMKEAGEGKCQHILDVLPTSRSKEKPTGDVRKPGKGEGKVHSATEMKEAGIKFRARNSSLKDISFTGRTLKLPVISLDDTTESTFLNMVAFERLHVGAGNEISSYIFFMNRIISDVKDVHLLKKKDIISNDMSSDEDAAKLFLTLSKEILHDPDSYLKQVYSDIDAELRNHFKETLHKWRYNLYHTYFRSPWALVSVIAGVFIFALTLIQTVYAILSFIQGKH